MYIIKKKVGPYTYYWNDLYERWEGLEDNATEVDNCRLNILMRGFLAGMNAEDYSFSKVGITAAIA